MYSITQSKTKEKTEAKVDDNAKDEFPKTKISDILDLDADPNMDTHVNFNEMKTVIKQIRDKQVEMKDEIK